MNKEEFIALLEQAPAGSEIVLMDLRMNLHHCSDAGSAEGIYYDFEIQVVPVLKGEGAKDINIAALIFENVTDYNADGTKIN